MSEPVPGAEPIDVLVEIPKGSRNKIEWDEARGVFRLDRVLYSSVHYPTDYGFIPQTLADDGDTLDALVLVEEPTFTGCLITARPVGVLHMRDEKGGDEKILCVPVRDPRFDPVRSLDDLSPHWLREIENFFETYKNLEDKQTEILGWGGADQARQVIAAGYAAYRDRTERA